MTKITVLTNNGKVIGIMSNGIRLPFDVHECSDLEKYQIEDFYNHMEKDA